MGNIMGRGLYIILTVQLSIAGYRKTAIIIGEVYLAKKICRKISFIQFFRKNIIYEDRVHK